MQQLTAGETKTNKGDLRMYVTRERDILPNRLHYAASTSSSGTTENDSTTKDADIHVRADLLSDWDDCCMYRI